MNLENYRYSVGVEGFANPDEEWIVRMHDLTGQQTGGSLRSDCTVLDALPDVEETRRMVPGHGRYIELHETRVSSDNPTLLMLEMNFGNLPRRRATLIRSQSGLWRVIVHNRDPTGLLQTYWSVVNGKEFEYRTAYDLGIQWCAGPGGYSRRAFEEINQKKKLTGYGVA